MALTDVWKLSDRANKICYIVGFSILLPSFVGYNIVADTSVWMKISPIIGGAVGCLVGYIRGRIKKGAS